MNETKPQQTIAYFSMEIALESKLPTYSGGLGILAGDTIRSAADLKLPMVAVSLVHRQGYFAQTLDADGGQTESPVVWDVAKSCRELSPRIQIEIEGRSVHVRAWQYTVEGIGGHEVPVILLDTGLPENFDWDRTLTDHLYGGDSQYRLCQEIVLGIGGVRMLRALGHHDVARFHMNEGHAALLGLELLDERARWFQRERFDHDDVEAIKKQCVFTTHTPVPAGHDKFPLDQVRSTLGRDDIFDIHEVFCCENELNMTYLALNLSHYVNGVAKKHGEVSREMLQPKDASHHYQIDHITNGVHLGTWASPSFADLFDRHIPGWREDNASLRAALNIPEEAVWQAHQAAKARAIKEVNRRTVAGFDLDTFTIGFARRAATYKRAELLLTAPEKLKQIASRVGPLQIIYGGKAHPKDEAGKQTIRKIVQTSEALGPDVRLVYLEDYDWELGAILTAGVDVWLNTPMPPLEASGTSGMKAALNGVPNLSVLDGWWIEGCIEGVTGWAIDGLAKGKKSKNRTPLDAKSLYQKLEKVVLPTYYGQRDDWLRVMRHAIALNAPHFNTQRMVQQYVVKAYFE
ncbi:alpha-glucan family phosphorylase [Coraliomargarita sp. SDUM461004]|uniref:glycogen phosphorylase n=1 Tax=Thalassobacterium sedimentorum TaxID=3041258 RepID=A0ABU1AKE1_9BACT|nr:alpha-glucan family phosphorylase [Coraliomargarita sp. SDUM461004]MDQ8195285.1 alpha-glucan family phosphorylase [Coraliomargarita sp. SDUM461004]